MNAYSIATEAQKNAAIVGNFARSFPTPYHQAMARDAYLASRVLMELVQSDKPGLSGVCMAVLSS